MSASETPKSRLETRSFPPVSTPAPPPPPAAPLKPLKPLSNMSCCHLSGSCLGLSYRCIPSSNSLVPKVRTGHQC
uniref:Uncharacterized protein n=1 Tax=Nothobranchius furzeri TaxID=105023 RepID=A0A8C6PAJ2_NOTFU